MFGSAFAAGKCCSKMALRSSPTSSSGSARLSHRFVAFVELSHIATHNNHNHIHNHNHNHNHHNHHPPPRTRCTGYLYSFPFCGPDVVRVVNARGEDAPDMCGPRMELYMHMWPMQVCLRFVLARRLSFSPQQHRATIWPLSACPLSAAHCIPSWIYNLASL